MFALLAEKEGIARVNLKCTPADVEMLTAEFNSIVPGYHMNKKHWVTVSLIGEVPEDMLRDLIDYSYKLIVSKFSIADKKTLL